MGIIGSIRKHSGIAVTVVGLAIVIFIVTGNDSVLNWFKSDKNVIAEVDGVSLDRMQFADMIDQEEAKIRFFAQDPSLTFNSDTEKALRDSLWANFVDEIVIGEQLKKLGLDISEAEVNDMYTGTFIHPFFMQNPQLRDSTGQYNRALMAAQLKNYNKMDALNQSYWDETKRSITTDRLRQKYATLVYSGFYMPAPIAKQIAEYGSKGVNVSVVSMPYDRVADNEIQLTDADYQQYFNTHKKEINRDVFRMDNREQREVMYAVFTAQSRYHCRLCGVYGECP